MSDEAKTTNWRRDAGYLVRLESILNMLMRGKKPWHLAAELECSLDQIEQDIERARLLEREGFWQTWDETDLIGGRLEDLAEFETEAWDLLAGENSDPRMVHIVAKTSAEMGAIYQRSFFDSGSIRVRLGNNVPGQAESLEAFQALLPVVDLYPWAHDFWLMLKKGWYWRDAVLIAWDALSPELRDPKKKKDLAILIKCTSRTVTNRLKNEAVQMEIANLAAEPWFKYRNQIINEVIPARIESAKIPGREGHMDAKMVLQAAGILDKDGPLINATAQAGAVAQAGAGLLIKEDIPEDDLDQLLTNLIFAEATKVIAGQPVDSESIAE